MTKKNGLERVYRHTLLLTIAAILALTSMAASAPQSETLGVSIKNFGRVNENYYRGAQPKGEEYAQLKRLGVKTVIDLRKDSQQEEPESVRSAGMKYFNIPLRASEPATDEQTAFFLKLVNDPSNWPVYVHCKGGRHRTGALTAIYRITHDGWTADGAFQEMKEYDFNNGLFGGPAKQKKYVYSFYERYSAGSGQGRGFK